MLISEPQTQRIPNKSFAELLVSVLDTGRPFRFQASGWSMHPFIHNGDILTITPIQSNLSVGDVVCCRSTDIPLFVHRIIRIDDDKIQIKGDNLISDDGIFKMDNLLGKVIRIERNGRISNFSLGFFRYIIAYLSGNSLLIPFKNIIRPIYRVFFNSGEHEIN
jgi:hypothetical protein